MKALVIVGFALIGAGLMMGLMPVTVGDDSYGDGFKCGSAFSQSDDLTDLGHETCLINGGGANRRAWALSLIVAGGIIVLGAAVSNYGRTLSSDFRPTMPPLPPQG